MHLGMINQRGIDQLNRQIKRPIITNADQSWHVFLPNAPSPFFGRDHFVVRVAELLLNRRHVTLCGPGGIGKTSLAKAVIHDSLIAERFRNRRFFTSFDGMDTTQISTRTVREQVCRAAGLDGRFNERWEEVMAFLTREDTILVIDNAEALAATRNADSMTRILDDLASSPSIVILVTTRSKYTFAPYLITQVVSVPTLEYKYAQETFEYLCPQQIPTDVIDELLHGVNNHPLSVNLLARLAAQHE
ncbi:P-loop containing nucleoside triphosphate hydrolase protein [Rhizopogon vinicolor AM-OR11-026]|uniref:p-loop containing nucleoside triphosphate hydrolase protein n=1 Tax=Rhizopogon vinicolor AM-OR11-026 TaxID=1314800 RepID=A0A1B7MLL5_9AGAM|nr:P-loop containing nucleoside triphosphate hydrolase protein [Rhizopogon vinicolor AM-OR11-026]